MTTMDPIERRITRCAIYTRKSTEHGLDAAVNSLETQRDVCQAYIKCQIHRNWMEVPYRYDDGGYSGGLPDLVWAGSFVTLKRDESTSLLFTRSTG